MARNPGHAGASLETSLHGRLSVSGEPDTEAETAKFCAICVVLSATDDGNSGGGDEPRRERSIREDAGTVRVVTAPTLTRQACKPAVRSPGDWHPFCRAEATPAREAMGVNRYRAVYTS
jgi:hypothetical protein